MSSTDNNTEPSKRPRSASPSSVAAGTSEPPAKKQAIEGSSEVAPITQASTSAPTSENIVNDAPKEKDAANTAAPTASGSGVAGEAPKQVGKEGKQKFNRRRGGADEGPKKGKNRGTWDPSAGSGKPERGDGGEEGVESGAKRLPKKRVALLIGYCGTGYSGMQIQPQEAKTIEGDVFEALVKAGAISSDNASDHRKVDVQRSARTDAGVHAAGNVISLKMIFEPPLPEGVKTLTEHVNSFLPAQIRMWGFVRTMNSFQARLACDSRIYEYLLPSYCLLPPSSKDPLASKLFESSPTWRDNLGSAGEFADATPDPEPLVEGEEATEPARKGEYERRRGWRVDEATLERFRALIKQFEGTHNFHNYTVGKPFNDKTVKRYMMSLEVRDPKVYGEIEWISVRIHGQSFMLHQIRKMMSLAMLACRTCSPPSLIPETFGPKRIHVPKAPPLGLLLQQPQFKTYNDRIKQKVGGLQEDRDPVNFEEFAETMEDFKVKWIYEKMRQDELETNVFQKWIRQVDCSTSPAFSFLNTQGIIPPEAAVGGVKQDNSAGGDKKAATFEGVEDSDDEEVDADALKKGELEG